MKNSHREVVRNEARTLRHFFRGQLLHVVALVLLVPMAYEVAAPTLGESSVLGVSDTNWFWVGIVLAVVHQIIVWLGWRAQLGWGLLTEWFGRHDMIVFGSVFFPFILARPLVVLLLGCADFGSLGLDPWTYVVLGTVLIVPAFYTLWSIILYFGFRRAMGGDHFRKEFQQAELVDQGIFSLCSNAMYVFGLLFLWSLAVYTNSRAALVLGLFQHVYVWVHYYGTEKPDMRLIYG